MKRVQVLAITGVTTGVIGSVAGAIITNRMYKGNKEAIKNGDIKDEKEIKKAKWKTGMAAVGTTVLAGLAIVSGVGLAMSYSKDDKNNYGGFLNEPKENNIEDDEAWLRALNEEEDLINELIENGESVSAGLATIRDEVNNFVSSINPESADRIYDILNNTEESIDNAYDTLDNASRNINVAQGIIENNM